MQRLTKLIIPAAGSGKRMNLPYPKTLFPVAGVPILGHILKAALPIADEAVVVVSPEGKRAVEDFLASGGFKHIRVTTQEKPIGMADAVELGVRALGSSRDCDYLVIWGDQVTVRRETIEATVVHHRKTAASLTLPTTYRKSPYIHIRRDAKGMVVGVLEAREGDEMPEQGESDCGVFVARGEHLIEGLAQLRAAMYDRTAGKYNRLDGLPSTTGEFNFLPIITLWAQSGLLVEALLQAETLESVGVNTREDAALVEAQLSGQFARP